MDVLDVYVLGDAFLIIPSVLWKHSDYTSYTIMYIFKMILIELVFDVSILGTVAMPYL